MRFVYADILEHCRDKDKEERIKVDDDDQPACDGQVVPLPNILDAASNANGEDSECDEREDHLVRGSARRSGGRAKAAALR